MPDENSTVTPRPDPTLLTTEALRREIALLNDAIRDHIEDIDRANNARITAAEKIRDEKIGRIVQRLDHNEAIRIEQKQDANLALDRALSAQSEQQAKIEIQIQTSIAKLEQLFQTRVDALSTKLDDLKDRVGQLETVAASNRQQIAETRASRTDLRGSVAIVATLVIVAITVIGFFAARGGP